MSSKGDAAQAIAEIEKSERERKRRQENMTRFETEWARNKHQLPGKYYVSETEKGEFFQGLGICESVFKYLISGSYRETEDITHNAQRQLLSANLDQFFLKIGEATQELLDCEVLKPFLGCLEKDRVYPYDEDDDLDRVFRDPEWVVKCISEAVGRTVPASRTENPKTPPAEVWELKGQYYRISEEINQMGNAIATGDKLNPGADIGHLQDLSKQLGSLSSTLSEYGLDGFGDEFASETKANKTVFETYRIPLVISLTLIQEITKILDFVRDEMGEHRARPKVNFPKSEKDRAVFIVWEVISNLKKKPVAYHVALAMHYLGFEPDLPLRKTKEEDSTVNRWSRRYYGKRRRLKADSEKLAKLVSRIFD